MPFDIPSSVVDLDIVWQQPSRSPERRVALRTRLAGEQNWRCCYCCVKLYGAREEPDAPAIEMIIPSSRGGSPFDADNLAVSCRECQQIRGEAIWPVHAETMRIGRHG